MCLEIICDIHFLYISLQTSPTDHAMNFLNEQFLFDATRTESHASPTLREFFLSHNPRQSDQEIFETGALRRRKCYRGGETQITLKRTLVLAKRSVKNYSRNLLAYGVRAGMYAGQIKCLFFYWCSAKIDVFDNRNGSDGCVSDKFYWYFPR